MEANFQHKINDLIGYRTDYLLHEIDVLWKELEIGSEHHISIDRIDAIFLKGISLQNGFKNAVEQINTKKDEYLSIRYKIDRKQHTLKSFGKMSNIKKTKIINILQLITLMKLVKQINDLSSLASGVRFFGELLEED